MNKADESPFGKKYLGWFFVSVVTVFMVSLILPFPISVIISIIVIFALSVIRADIAMKKGWHGRDQGLVQVTHIIQIWSGGHELPIGPNKVLLPQLRRGT